MAFSLAQGINLPLEGHRGITMLDLGGEVVILMRLHHLVCDGLSLNVASRGVYFDGERNSAPSGIALISFSNHGLNLHWIVGLRWVSLPAILNQTTQDIQATHLAASQSHGLGCQFKQPAINGGQSNRDLGVEWCGLA
jgi:hypothetical protein